MQVQPNPSKLTVTRAEGPKELFMSFALLNRLTLLIGGSERLPMLGSDPEMQEAVLCEVFSQRDKKGAFVQEVTSLEELSDLSLDDVENVFSWVGAHISDFFVRRVERTMVQATGMNNALQKFQPTPNGSSS
jgi:hypothetical protein